MGVLAPGAKSLVPKNVPAGWGRGMVVVFEGTKNPLLETGTVGEVWKVVKPVPLGPKG